MYIRDLLQAGSVCPAWLVPVSGRKEFPCAQELGQEPGTNFSALGLNMLGLKFIGQKMGQLNPRYPGSSADLNYIYQQEMRYLPLKLIQAVYF